MAVRDRITATVLAVRIIPSVNEMLALKLGLKEHQCSLGLITCTIDDSLYVAIDHATKRAHVEVIYAHSFYAGSAHASGPLSGEVIAMLAGENPGEVQAGVSAAMEYVEQEAFWYSANDDDSLAYFPHLIARSGSYLSKLAGIPLGDPLAYLIAPPLEGIFAIDAALKAADVTMVQYFAPPTETNFTGALLTGTQAACAAACSAFEEAVLDVALRPVHGLR